MDVLQLLAVAYGGEREARLAATAQLEAALNGPDAATHLCALLRAGVDTTIPPAQSLSALIYAKNCIVHTLDEEQLSTIPGVLDEVKTLLYNGVFVVSEKHQNIICECVANIISAFEWNYLPQLMPEITRDKASVSVEHALASLRLLYVYIKRFKTPQLEPMPLKLEVCSCLLTALPSFLSYTDLRVDHMVLKAMECVVETALQVKETREIPATAFDAWFQEMSQYPERHFVSACEAAANGSQKVYETYVRCLKRIAMISFSVLNDATRNKKPPPIAKRFLTTHAAAFFGVWKRWLEYAATSKARSLHQKADMFAIRYIKLCTLDKTLYQQYLLPELMHVVESLFFPYLCFNEEDESAFADDSDLSDFVQYMMEEGFDQGEISQRQAASNAILAMIKGGKDYHEDSLQKIIQILTVGLSQEDNNETFPRTFGFLHLLSVLRKHLRKVPEIWQTQMAQVLVTFVAPRVLPTVPFVPLRCKALVVCQRYSKVPIASEEHFASFTQLICSLVQDSNARIRLGAIDAMCTFLEMKRALPYIRPILVPLVEECIGFLNRVQTTFVPTALLYLVEHFAPELTFVLGKIGKTLVQHFLATAFDLAQQEEAMNEDNIAYYSRADMSACAMLDALDTIVQASRHNIETINNMRSDLLLLAKKVLEYPDNYEFMEKTLIIVLHVNNFSKPIPSDCWEILPLLFNSIDTGVGVDFFVGIEEVLDSYVSNGTVQYFQNTELMEATYKACEKMLFNAVCGVEDHIAVPQLIEAMLHQAKHCKEVSGLFDPYLSRFVLLLLRALADETIRQSDVRLQIWIVAAMMDAFYYNAGATLQIIMEHNAYPQFFDAFFHFFRGAIGTPETVKKGKKGKRNNKNDNAQEIVDHLSILTRKVIALGLTSLLEYLAHHSNLSGFDVYMQPTLTLIEYCIFRNDALLEPRCRISEKNIAEIRSGNADNDEVVDVDFEDDDVLGIDDGDDDDNDDDNMCDIDSEDSDTDALQVDEGDDYESPIDDVCEVSRFLQWAAAAPCLGNNTQSSSSQQQQQQQQQLRCSLHHSLEEFRAAEATALRYRQLVLALEAAMEDDFKARSSAAAVNGNAGAATSVSSY
ncbi:importin 7 [Trypanosoma theileri]|uniref:Importin 7 n=1 Tax=Trypanosoma theileri TaxID=67003 RepID=A0A1X0P003_9TRYP|nr:importin 7 [Trypanosoma theileri]ORC90276.1 importin 7 [Trypanosoma theileri]